MSIADTARRSVDNFFASEECDKMLCLAMKKIVDEENKWKAWRLVQPPNSSQE